MCIYHSKTQSIRKAVWLAKKTTTKCHVIQPERQCNGMTPKMLVILNLIRQAYASKKKKVFMHHSLSGRYKKLFVIGFSTAAQTWLPVAANYTENNVKLQKSKSFSHLKIFKKLLDLRRNPTLRDGTYESVVVDNVLVYKRELSGTDNDVFYIVLNFGSSAVTVDLTKHFSRVSTNVEVVVASLQSAHVAG